MTEAIIFDFYGVLAINGWQAFKQKHFSHQPEKWNDLYELGRQVDAGLADYEELVNHTAKASGASYEDVKYQLEHTTRNESLLQYIAVLKQKYKIGLLSNASNDEALKRIFSAEQTALFDVIILSKDVGLTKPDIGMYQEISNRLGVLPPNCVFVDDQDRHCAGARSAGMQAILYENFESFKSELSELLADTKN